MKIKKMVPRSIKDSLKFLRISKPVTRVLGSPYPPPDHRKLQLDITYACNLTCPSCNRSSPQARAKDEMTMEQVEKFIEESVDSGRMWRQIKIMGGEPTLHPRFLG